MNKIIFLLTISAAITFSIFARAELSPRLVNVSTTGVQFDAESMTLSITGNLPTQCVVTPHPTLSKTANPEVLVLSVLGSDLSETCAMMTGGNYELAFDIRSLKFNLSDLNIDPNATYKIITRDGTAIATVAFGASPLNLPYATDNVIGGVFAIENGGRSVLVVSPTEILQINSPFIDVAAFNGKRVELQGHLVKMRAPGARLNPGIAMPSSLLLTGISTTAF